MLTTTKAAIKAILATDQTIAQADIPAIMAALDGRDATLPRFLRPREAAKALGVTTTRVAQIARAGGLTRIQPSGQKRPIGYTFESINALLSGRK